MGGKLVSDVDKCDIVFTDGVRRTAKFLRALCLGKPIVGDAWIRASAKAGHFEDPDSHILKDGKNEKKYGFALQQSIMEARAAPSLLLTGQSFFVSKKIPALIKDIIKSAGGTVSTRANADTFVLCDKSEKRKYPDKVYSTELVLTGILQQKFEPEAHEL
eukprot:m.23681 g.23681  ORF g.23681 m.23681 type:complete len:160 (+) comp8524_c0_seq3:3466-3945(+)